MMETKETTKCPLCGHDNAAYFFTERDYDLVSCENCDLFYITPYPGDTAQVHERVSKYEYEKLQVVTPETHYAAARQFYHRYHPMIEEELENASSMLDVGCGTGRLLELVGQNHDADQLLRTGIELNTERAEFARRRAQCEVKESPMESFETSQKFDVITMINVLSHLPSFDVLFGAVRSLLAPQGKFILKVGEYTKNVKKDAIYDWGIPDHLHFLGLRTLEYMCDKYGFKILRHERLPLSELMFTRDKWKAPGRSRARNLVKRVLAYTPFALRILKKLYDLRSGKAIHTSFVVLTPENEKKTVSRK